MDFALTTHWNAGKHGSGEEMIQEILELGFQSVELGYDLTFDLVPGVKKMVKNNSVKVVSLHNFCPVPVGAPFGHPELFHLSSTDRAERMSAIKYTINTVEFAAEVGASCVVAHSGNVNTRNLTRKLLDMAQADRQFENSYQKHKLKVFAKREKKVQKHLDALYKSIEEMLPTLEQLKITLALENLPAWESIPSETEMEQLCIHFDSPYIRYWHDIGHAQTRQNLGLIAHHLWLERLSPFLAGMHIHDVLPPANDHIMPPRGNIDFNNFKNYINDDILHVMEPKPNTPAEDIITGVDILKNIWEV